MYRTDKIKNRAAWFRSIRPGEIAKGKFSDTNALDSISVQLTKFNASSGKKAGVFLHAKYLREELCVILVGVTLAQRKKELANPDYRNEWRKMIERWEKQID
jgi:hypothetical protein